MSSTTEHRSSIPNPAPPNVEQYTTDDMTLEQLEAKYGKLTWNEEHQDFTDADGFVRASCSEISS